MVIVDKNELRNIGILKCFSEDDFCSLLPYIDIIQFKPGEFIIREGERGGGLFIIVDGKVDINKGIEGDSVTIATLEKGDFFGETDIISEGPRMASAIAKTETSVANIKKEGMENIEKHHPTCSMKLYKVIAQILSKRLKNMDDEYLNLFLKTKGKKKINELKTLREKLIKDWEI